MSSNHWHAVLEVAQCRWAYLAFVCALPIETWLIWNSLPPGAELTPMGVSVQLPATWAVISASICAAFLWPPLLILLARQERFPPFYAGAAIGVITIAAAIFFAVLSFTAFEIATNENTDWGFVVAVAPIWIFGFLFAPQTWLALACSSIAGGFIAAFSEAVW